MILKKDITRNFFLQGDGICLKHNLLLMDSVHLYPNHIIHQYYTALKEYYIARYARSGKYKKLDPNEIYLVAYHPWFNYYHWLIESIPRIIKYKDSHSELSLLLIKPHYDIAFVRDSLKPFAFKSIIVNDIWNYHITQGIISPIQRYCYIYEASVIQEVRALYHTYFIKEAIGKPTRKIYVSRRNALKRKFENEQEVIKVMLANGFEIIDLEDATLENQIKLFAETRCFVTIHGAALTNMLFMQKGSIVLELRREKTTLFDHKSKVYSNLSIALDLQYDALNCKAVHKKDDFFTGNLIVDIKALQAKMERIFQL